MVKSRLRESAYKAFHEKNSVQRQIARRLFSTMQAIGFHLSADHFYDTIPNTNLVKKNYSDDPRPCTGIDLRFEESEQFLVQSMRKYAPEISGNVITQCGFVNSNPYFKNLDAIALYIHIREHRPRKIIEVGQGMSTRIISSACKCNWEEDRSQPLTTLTTIDPYARIDTSEMCGDWMVAEVVRNEVQSIDPSLFAALDENDLMFIDSSHVYKFGSDVEFEFQHVYPHLSPGSFVHIHDVFTPYEYPKRWLVKRKQFWNEQYHLEQFLRFNSMFEVVLPVHLLCRRSTSVADAFASALLSDAGYSVGGTSFYLKRTG
ncbi:MAG: class I SAM-dependent methyltransferase [Gemmatimonadales bacterium]|nr:class I SAM-dependent methyltransferase [Gemmatimonadales bacterium]